ncbi:hypothetical protein Z947_555 [Sulfitobacter geojensis]|nr:hypothetical protein Z947_555 [Sulfitobacter geojensis]
MRPLHDKGHNPLAPAGVLGNCAAKQGIPKAGTWTFAQF